MQTSSLNKTLYLLRTCHLWNHLYSQNNVQFEIDNFHLNNCRNILSSFHRKIRCHSLYQKYGIWLHSVYRCAVTTMRYLSKKIQLVTCNINFAYIDVSELGYIWYICLIPWIKKCHVATRGNTIDIDGVIQKLFYVVLITQGP